MPLESDYCHALSQASGFRGGLIDAVTDHDGLNLAVVLRSAKLNAMDRTHGIAPKPIVTGEEINDCMRRRGWSLTIQHW